MKYTSFLYCKLLVFLLYVVSTSNAGICGCAKEIALQITNIYENGDTEFHYDYCEYLGDGRGITAGIAGFCTGTGDAWEMIKVYHQLSGGTDDFSPMDSILEKYANSNSDSQAGLEDYCKVFADLAKNDAKFRQAQDKIRDETYLAPSQKLADQVGLKLSISQGQMYDTGLMHGPGDDPDGLASIIKETSESFTSDQTGDSGSTLTINGNQVDEIVWLKKFLEVRSDHLTNPRDPENQGGNYWAQTLYRIESYQNAIDQKEYKWTSSVKLLDNDGGPITVTCSKSLRKRALRRAYRRDTLSNRPVASE